MLNPHTLSTFEKTFPVESSIHAIQSVRPDSTAKAILERVRMPKAERQKFDAHLIHRDAIFAKHSSLSIMLANGYMLAEKFWDYSEAAKRLEQADEALTLRDINLSVSDDELCEIAEHKARRCELKIKTSELDYGLFQWFCSYVAHYELTPPELQTDYFTCKPAERFRFAKGAMEQLSGAINRFACPLWWRRKLRKKQALVVEQLARDLRVVHKKSSPYVSEFTIRNRRERTSNNDKIMSELFVVPHSASPFAEFETLKDVADRSSTSGVQLAAELMVRIRGFEECAKVQGHVGEFYTLTAPSRFHSVLASGIPNKKYDGSSPTQAQDYFNDIWQRARAQFAKHDIRPYGFRVVEPHHDGCPHWHMLLFLDKGQSLIARRILKALCTEDSPKELRTSTARFKAIHIDPNKGSAAGYIAKYITKAVNGNNISSVKCQEAGDLTVLPAEAAERASAWASTFGIRRFQQIGGPSVTTWRELRKLGQGDTGKCEVANSMNTTLDTISRFALEKVRAAADASDWAAFCLAMGGVQVKRKDQTVRIHYQIPDIVDRITGEISRSESRSPYFATKYGDMPAKRILGVAWDSIVVITRRGTAQILSEADIKAQQKIMIGVSDSIHNWMDDGRYLQPSKEEMDFLEACVIEDIQNMCLFMDYEPLASVIRSDEVAGLDLCQ